MANEIANYSLKTFNQTLVNPKTQEYLNQTLGKRASLFTNNILAVVSNSAVLQKCKPLSVIYAGMQATANDLPLGNNLGFAYVIPYGQDAQFQMGYKGFIQLAQRSGQMRIINVREVKEGELVGEDFVSGELQFKMLPYGDREKARTVGYVGFFELTNGFRKMEYWSVEKLEQHAELYSQTYKSYKKYNKGNGGVWASNFDAMAKKTVLKNLISKYAPLSVQMQNAISADQAVFHEDNSQSYEDNNEGGSTFEQLKAEVQEEQEQKQGKQAVSKEDVANAEVVEVEEVTAPAEETETDLFKK